jgi:hypothetical protein
MREQANDKSEYAAEGHALGRLLKAPLSVAQDIAAGEATIQMGLFFLVAAAVCYALFGLAVGLFSGWSVAWMTAVKAPMIALFSLLLCFPSLYVFSCVGGSALSIKQTFALGTSCLAISGLLLVGLAPVAWLFAISTANLSFVVLLTFFTWLVAIGFMARYIGKIKRSTVFERFGGIGVWFVIFILVTLQMTTVLRPILTKPDSARGWWTSEKQFFLQHYGSCFSR